MLINDLPYEILDKIFRYVAHDDDAFQDPIRTLASISRTSRRLHYPAQPALYSAFEEFNKRTLLKYLKTILDCPRLAASVKTYHGWHRPWTFTKYSANLSFSVWRLKNPRLMKIIWEIAINEDESQDWFDAMEEGSWDATTALALAHLPNLQHLSLTIIGIHQPYSITRAEYEVGNYYWIREALMRAAQLQHEGISSPLALEHLTTLTIHPNRENCRELSMSQLLPLLKMKSLRKLFARGWDLDWGSSVTISLTIVELELLDFTMENIFFMSFFECFPALEKLRYEHSSERSNPRSPFITMSLAHVLIQLRPPLKELYIENGSRVFAWVLLNNTTVYRPFSQFESLEVIDMLAFDQWIDISGFYDNWKSTLRPLVELLPSKIKRLALRDASTWTISQVMDLLHQKDKVQNLEALTIELGPEVRLDAIEGELSLLRETSARCGVQLSVQGGIFSGPIDYDSD
ncbi:hypothetical protein N431DRAFT_494319 [Stipitochalara longipes BDJ]|nr:hypothetical protein N431DRAFT_494319 [Stipitochalara longipes BDJ]